VQRDAVDARLGAGAFRREGCRELRRQQVWAGTKSRCQRQPTPHPCPAHPPNTLTTYTSDPPNTPLPPPPPPPPPTHTTSQHPLALCSFSEASSSYMPPSLPPLPPSLPPRQRHTRTVPSSPPDTSRPPGAGATAATPAGCASCVSECSVPVRAPYVRMTPSAAPAMTVDPDCVGRM
jgi:hypothetical protein